MRDCPICDSPTRTKIKAHYASAQWILYRCQCGMLYLDSLEATEEGMNLFYRNIYTTADDPYSADRLDSLAKYIIENCRAPGVDIGGTDGKLASRIHFHMDTSGAGDQLTGLYQTVVLSHTLEHVYNVRGILEKIKKHLLPNGRIVVEVPIWNENDDWHNYDYHFEHIQKFTPQKLEELFVRHGFEIMLSVSLPRYIEYNCHRLMAQLK